MAVLPALITLGNGACGLAAIAKIGQGMALAKAVYFQQAAWLILAAMVFDAMDGLVARITRTASTFGAQLDTLCDLVTFGVAPGFLVFAVTRQAIETGSIWERPVQAVCVLYALCALLRLARFTVETSPDERQHREFSGLPSPAAAGVLAAAILPVRALQEMGPTVERILTGALPGLALGTAILMVSRIRYAHLVNRLLRGKRPFVSLVELTLLAALIFLFREFAVFLAFLWYAVGGPLEWMKNRMFARRSAPGAAVHGAPPSTGNRGESMF